MSNTLNIGGVSVGTRTWIAPMTGVSDLPFRRAASRLGAGYVATEMVACASFAQGRPDVVRRAAVGEGLPLMVVQLVGSDPDHLAMGAKLAAAAGAQIIDINFGCPAKEVTRGAAAGSALMREPELAERLISATVDAVNVPVTIKIRLGWDDASRNAPQFAARAQALGVAAVTVHGRTRCQFYKGEADWPAIGDVRQAITIPLIANGDITDSASARLALQASGADAVMVGRGVYGKPWISTQIEAELSEKSFAQPSQEAELAIILDHFADSLRFYGDHLGLRIFRKHLAAYVDQGSWSAAPEARRQERQRLCRLDTALEIERALRGLWLAEREGVAA